MNFKIIMKVNLNQVKNIYSTVKKNFPYESPWLVRKTEYGDFFSRCKNNTKMNELVFLQRKLIEQDKILDFVRESYQYLEDCPFKYFKSLIEAVHKYKVQNCGETARITYAVSRINQVKESDINFSVLVSEKSKNNNLNWFSHNDDILDVIDEDYEFYSRTLDHIVTQIKVSRETPIIIDTSLNELAEKSRMEKIYQEKYSQIFNIEPEENIKILDVDFDYTNIPVLDDIDARKLGELFPSLLFKELKSLTSKKNYFFINIFSITKE